MTLFSKLTWILALSGGIIYGLSFVGYIIPFVNLILFLVIIAVTLNLTIKNLSYGVLILIFELIIGGKGYLFSVVIGDNFVLSLRLALFLIVMAVWLITAIRNKKLTVLETPYFKPLLALLIITFVGILVGYYTGNPLAAIFFDFNGYLYFALALPLFEVIRTKDFDKKLFAVFVGGVLALSFLSVFLFTDFYFTKDWARPSLTDSIATESATAEEAAAGKFAFGNIQNRWYDESGKPVEYRWQKDIGLGAISYVSGSFFRVFSSSQIWVLFGFLLAAYLALRRFKWDRENKYLIFFALLTFATLFISFSRSFWIGAAGGIILLLFFLPKKRAIFIVIVLAILIFVGLLGTYFVAPATYQTLTSRVTSIFNPSDELASQNRINLLQPILVKMKNKPLIGHGFGTPVIYESVVPEKQGFIKVFAYEWGYLDQIVKFGIVGMAAFIWLLVSIFKTAYRTIKPDPENYQRNWILIGLIVGLGGMLITHLTSPYLNHPLGIGFILVVAAVAWLYLKQNSGDNINT